MNRDTIVEIAIPKALYESIKGKLLKEAKKKPSAGLTKAEKSTIAKKAAAGKDIGKKGKGFEKVAAKAAKEYGSKEAGKKVAAAAMWKAQAGKKKMNEEEEMYDLYIINPEKRWNRSAPYWAKIKDTSKPMTKAEVHKMELELMHDPHVGGYPKEYWTVVKAGEYPEEPAKEPELPKEDLKTNQNIIQRILSKITGKKKVNEEEEANDFYMGTLVQANDTYEKGLEAYSEGDMLKAERMYQAAVEMGSEIGLQFPTYKDMTSGNKK